MIEMCPLCRQEILGGHDTVARLPSPFSSHHEVTHLKCYLGIAVAEAIAAEREACAKLIEYIGEGHRPLPSLSAFNDRKAGRERILTDPFYCAAAIRARSEGK